MISSSDLEKCHPLFTSRMDLLGGTAPILNSVVSNSYYGILWGKNDRIQNGRLIVEKIHRIFVILPYAALMLMCKYCKLSLADFFSVVYSPTRKSSLKDVPVQRDDNGDLDRMLNDFQQQRAAKALQRQWRGYQGRKKQQIAEQERQRENQAASTLQKNWRTHRDRVREFK